MKNYMMLIANKKAKRKINMKQKCQSNQKRKIVSKKIKCMNVISFLLHVSRKHISIHTHLFPVYMYVYIGCFHLWIDKHETYSINITLRITSNVWKCIHYNHQKKEIISKSCFFFLSFFFFSSSNESFVI